MSVFRPAVRVTAPDGREWEIYAYKVRVDPSKEWDTDVLPADDPLAAANVEFAAVNAVTWIVTLVPRLLVWLARAAVAAVRALVSDVWWVDAVTFSPHRQCYRWRTDAEHRGQVLAQVEGSFARGHVPQNLRNATYEGWSRSAR